MANGWSESAVRGGTGGLKASGSWRTAAEWSAAEQHCQVTWKHPEAAINPTVHTVLDTTGWQQRADRTTEAWGLKYSSCAVKHVKTKCERVKLVNPNGFASKANNRLWRHSGLTQMWRMNYINRVLLCRRLHCNGFSKISFGEGALSSLQCSSQTCKIYHLCRDGDFRSIFFFSFLFSFIVPLYLVYSQLCLRIRFSVQLSFIYS